MGKPVTILGAGAWGTAIAHLLASNGHDVLLWSFEPSVAQDINDNHTNSYYLPGIQLPTSVRATSSLSEACGYASTVFEAIPVLFLRSTLERVALCSHAITTWVILSKGIEQRTGFVPEQIIRDVFQNTARHFCTAVLSGPSFARDLAEKKPTGVMLAYEERWRDHAGLFAELLSSDYFRFYVTHDLMGVQLGGALKNIIALTLGIALGANARDNTRAWLLTEGLRELVLIAEHYGADSKTLYGLAGFGDLILTCTGSLSKNMMLGVELGKGALLSTISSEGVLPEGINTLRSIVALASQAGLNVPLIQATHDIVFEGHSFERLLAALQE